MNKLVSNSSGTFLRPSRSRKARTETPKVVVNKTPVAPVVVL